jgi:hypothetical protein
MPRFYLREFSTPETRRANEAQVWIFSKNDADGDEQLASVRKVCSKRYLYSPRDPEGRRSWKVENDLSSIESLLAQIWPQVSGGFIDLSNDALRKALALFVATTYMRNPSKQEACKAIHEHIVRSLEELPNSPGGAPNITSILHNGNEIPFDPSGWDTYRAWVDDAHHAFFTQMVRSESGSIANTLLNKRWSILLAESELFITSDNPIMVDHDSRETFGIGTEGSTVSFPLSPTRMLVMDDLHEEPGNKYYPLKEGSIGALNFATWHASNRFMVTGRPVHSVLSEIVEYADAQGIA